MDNCKYPDKSEERKQMDLNHKCNGQFHERVILYCYTFLKRFDKNKKFFPFTIIFRVNYKMWPI